MKERRRYVGVMDLLPLGIAVLFLLGALTIFSPCPAQADGSWMTCHWAGMAVRGTAGALAALELLHALPIGPGRKEGLDLAVLVTSGLLVLIPGHLIPLCMMDTMRCRTVTAAAVWLFAVLAAAVSAVDIPVQLWRGRRRNPRPEGKTEKPGEETPSSAQEEPDSDDEKGTRI